MRCSRRSSAIRLVGPNPAMGCPMVVLDSLFVGGPDLPVPNFKSKDADIQDSECGAFAGLVGGPSSSAFRRLISSYLH